MVPDARAHGARGARRGVIVDIDHNGQTHGAKLVESYIDGAWHGTMQLTPELWKLVKSGARSAFSVGGFGHTELRTVDGKTMREIVKAGYRSSVWRRPANRDVHREGGPIRGTPRSPRGIDRTSGRMQHSYFNLGGRQDHATSSVMS